MSEKIIETGTLQTFFAGLKNLFVQQVSGKGLSTNDYTTTEKNKLAAQTALTTQEIDAAFTEVG